MDLDADALIDANRAIRQRSTAELLSLWESLDHADAAKAAKILLAEMPDLVVKYGDMASAIAMDLYLEWREQVGARGSLLWAMSRPPQVEAVQASTRYAIGGLFREPADPRAVFALLSNDVLDRNVQNRSRETIAQAVADDPAEPRWARIPVGKTCEWCLMLGSRGFEAGLGYRSELTAAAGSHGSCDCLVVPEWATGKTIDDYDPDAVRAQWRETRDARLAEKAAQTSQR